MSIILNIVVLFICLRWLYKSNRNNGVLTGIVFTFIGGTFFSFIFALALEHDFMDGVTHLIIAGGSAIIFWLLSIVILLTQTNKISPAEKFAKISITSIVILLPLLIYLMIFNMTLKIGG